MNKREYMWIAVCSLLILVADASHFRLGTALFLVALYSTALCIIGVVELRSRNCACGRAAVVTVGDVSLCDRCLAHITIDGVGPSQRARAACQTLVAAIGSVGPESVEDVAVRAAAHIEELEERSRAFEDLEASLCPEDTGFAEIVPLLRKRISELEAWRRARCLEFKEATDE